MSTLITGMGRARKMRTRMALEIASEVYRERMHDMGNVITLSITLGRMVGGGEADGIASAAGQGSSLMNVGF